jgi:CBS domain-containing protein
MRPSLITCPPSMSLGDAAAMLARHRIHALIVADAAGLAQGVLSDFDLLAGEWLPGRTASGPPGQLGSRLTAGDLMSTPVASVNADTPAAEAAQRMLASRIHRLVVTDLDRPIGVISVSDLIAGLAPAHNHHGRVEHAMSRGLVVCRETTTVGAAARAMREQHSRSLVVVNLHGRPLGVVTGFDLLPFYGEADPGGPVSSIMHAPITVHPAASLREAAGIMLEHHVHRLVVVDPAEPDSMPLGLIATSDIVMAMVGVKD